MSEVLTLRKAETRRKARTQRWGRILRKALIISGVALLLALLGGGVYYGYPLYATPQLEASSKAYVDQTIPAIVSGWSQDALTSRCTPQLNQDFAGAKITTMFDHLLLLGSLTKYDGSKGQANVRLSMHSGWVASASYTADVTCEYGKVEFDLDLSQIHGEWVISGLKITAPQERPKAA